MKLAASEKVMEEGNPNVVHDEYVVGFARAFLAGHCCYL